VLLLTLHGEPSVTSVIDDEVQLLFAYVHNIGNNGQWVIPIDMVAV